MDRSVAVEHGLFRGLYFIDEVFDGLHEVNVELEFVVVHVVRHMQIRFTVAFFEEFFGVRMWDEGVSLSVNYKHGTIRLLNIISISKLLIYQEANKTCPSKNGFGSILDARVWRH